MLLKQLIHESKLLYQHMEPSFKSLVDVNNPFLPIYMNMTGKFHENSGIRAKKEWRDVFWMLFNNRG
ncbi:MAG: hypothetical protein ACK521_12430 [bacterium]